MMAVAAPPIAIATECLLRTTEPPPREPEDSAAIRRAKEAIHDYDRSGASTYLTLPEWFIVYNTEEYAATLATSRPSSFPYFKSVYQYWTYYRRVCEPACARYPFDAGNHLMLGVIGASYSIENTLKGVYESTIGRLTESFASTDTAEDRYAAATAAEYGRFMHMTPWYEFPFHRKLTSLWTETPWRGPHQVRKWERRVALTLEFGIKAIYGWTIRKATKMLYGDEDLWVYGVAEHVPADVFHNSRVRSAKTLGPNSHVLAITRYEEFTRVVPQLVAAGVRFSDIAGNRRILVTAIADRMSTLPDDERSRVLFSVPLATAERQRLAIDARVDALGDLLKRLAAAHMTLEHIYDY
jgi:hypothetical protein